MIQRISATTIVFISTVVTRCATMKSKVTKSQIGSSVFIISDSCNITAFRRVSDNVS